MDSELQDIVIENIRTHVREGNVLYFASGGSSIPVSVAILNSLTTEERARVIVTLTDERYGSVGHADSNWQQLKDHGLQVIEGHDVPVLRDDVVGAEDTARVFSERLRELLASEKHTIAVFGIGADFHIAGLLPHCPALLEKDAYAYAYQGHDFERITITPPVFPQIRSAYVYGRGEKKHGAIESLSGEFPYATHPSQLVKLCGESIIKFYAS